MPGLFDDPVQTVWHRPTRLAGRCRRAPNAGPGSCHYWWESCIADKRSESRGCFALWADKMNRLGYVMDALGEDFAKVKLPDLAKGGTP